MTGSADSGSCVLEARGLCVEAAGRRLVSDLDFSLHAGDFVCLLGPNGVGKTLSLHTLAGLRAPAAGRVSLLGRPLERLDRRQIARQLGLLLQHHEDAFPATVLETALLGRHAHLGFLEWERSADLALARAALARVDLAGLEQRPAQQLSGGERRRLAVATLMVQDPLILLLDEPLNHLDPAHRFLVLDTLAALAAEGRAIVASLHDPALAAHYASSVLLLYGDGRWQAGPAAELLTAERMSALYQTAFASYRRGDEELLIPVPTRPAA
ncbi:MAG: ABC transporter ATP-binding protein [Gammaproteobacteria bacterium]|nr:MAG: ABC transporter ATP-binding protein [Gammaproteobacteria bacterium]